jgi:hypothetical protein
LETLYIIFCCTYNNVYLISYDSTSCESVYNNFKHPIVSPKTVSTNGAELVDLTLTQGSGSSGPRISVSTTDVINLDPHFGIRSHGRIVND